MGRGGGLHRLHRGRDILPAPMGWRPGAIPGEHQGCLSLAGLNPNLMKEHLIGIVMNGVTGRMGTNQHLIRSILAIRKQGGVLLDSGDVVIPEPILVGRNPDKLKALAEANGLARFTTNLGAALKDPFNQIYFDAQSTDRRAGGVRQAIAAKKAIYCEKPIALDTATAVALY